MKTILNLIILTLITSGCSKKEIQKDKKSRITEIEHKKEKIFTQVAEFPTIKDTTQFISNLCQTFDLKVEKSAIQKENQKISTYKKVKLNGTDNEFYFIEYNWINGCDASYPWKYQLLLTKKGKLVKLFNADRYEFVKIFKKENPFLLTTIVSGHGNGGHRIYKVSADTLENIYEGYYDFNLQTYDADQTTCVFKPYELNISFKDNNHDGYNDIIFSGEKLMLGKYTKDGFWYDVEDGKPFTEENPGSIIPIKYIFIYDKKTKHFKAKEKYKSFE